MANYLGFSKSELPFINHRAVGSNGNMVDLQGTNPVSGDQIDTTDPGTWANYLIGGTVLVAAVMFGKFVTDTASDATDAGDTVSDTVMELT